MNWNQLQYVITIAEEKSITKAAQKLYISQPSLSLSIQALEKETGIPLFERNRGEMKLTYAGSLFYEWAISTLHSHTQLEWKLGDIVSGSRTLIRLGLSPHRSERLLVKESFVLAIPDSLCPFSDPSQKEEDISATPQIHLPALSAIPFILLSEDHDLGKISRKICETVAFHPNIRCICTSSNTAFSLARRGMGATFLPEIYARTTSFPNIHFFTPDHFHDTRDICAVYRKNIYHHAQFQALLALLHEIVPAIYRAA